MMNKTKYEKPKLLKLGYDDQLAVGGCNTGNGNKPTCNPNGGKADACGPGGNYTPCASGPTPVS